MIAGVIEAVGVIAGVVVYFVKSSLYRRAILILALLVSHDFQGTVGDDLVGIHID